MQPKGGDALWLWLGVKTGMACLQVKLCVAISERFRKCNWYLKALFTHVQVDFALFFLLN